MPVYIENRLDIFSEKDNGIQRIPSASKGSEPRDVRFHPFMHCFQQPRLLKVTSGLVWLSGSKDRAVSPGLGWRWVLGWQATAGVCGEVTVGGGDLLKACPSGGLSQLTREPLRLPASWKLRRSKVSVAGVPDANARGVIKSLHPETSRNTGAKLALGTAVQARRGRPRAQACQR